MSRTHLLLSSASRTDLLLWILGPTVWMRHGASSAIERPLSHLSVQKSVEVPVDAKSALNAKHTASRTKLASHAQRAKDVPVNFSWKLTKDKTVKYQSLELAGWYQTVPYLRLRSQMRWHIAIESYLPTNYSHSGNRKREKVTLPNGWREHDSDRSLFEQGCTYIKSWPIPIKINIK
jgi:hypothetical protein